jgi:hypothetical protein
MGHVELLELTSKERINVKSISGKECKLDFWRNEDYGK